MEAEIMCEVGVWKNFDELEDSIILDELYLLYEATTERQIRIMKAVSAAFGGGSGDSEPAYSSNVESLEYEAGEIGAGENTIFGYNQRKDGWEIDR